MVSFRGQKKVGPSPDLSPLGVQLKIPNEHPRPFHMGALPGRVPNRFLKMMGLPYLNARIRDFTAKLGPGSGWKVLHWTRDARRRTSDITIGFTGLNKNVGRDDGIVKPYLLERRDLRFDSKIGARFGIESRGRRIRGAKNNHRAYGAEQKCGRDAGLNWRPFIFILTFLLNRSLRVLYAWFVGLFYLSLASISY